MDQPIDVVRRFADAYAAGDWATTDELQAEDAVFVLPEGHPEAGAYRGPDEIRGYFRRWLGTWEEYEYRAERFVADGDRVAVLAVERGRGKASGAFTEIEAGQVYTVRDGKVVRWDVYLTWEETLAALRS